MNIDEQGKSFEDLVIKCREVLISKGNDYTAGNDRLSNFKVAGAVAGISAEQNCLSLISTKVARIGALLKSDRVPCNEAIQDSVLDLINYGILLNMLFEERRGTADDPFDYNRMRLGKKNLVEPSEPQLSRRSESFT